MNLTYESSIQAAVTDFEALFTPASNFTVSYSIIGGSFYAKVVGDAQTHRLLFSRYLADQKVESIDDLMFGLIIVGHELAHYVNKHNSHNDESKLDSVALESWADYFGARIMFTLLTFGSTIDKIVDDLLAVPFCKPCTQGERQSLILRAVGRALRRTFDTLYKQTDGSAKYPKSDVRAQIFLAGVVSFFYRFFGDLKENWTLYVLKRTVIENGLAAASYDSQAQPVPDTFFERLREIHSRIKGPALFITAGLKLEYWNMVGTHYVDDESVRDQRRAHIQKELKKWNFSIGDLVSTAQ
jgi:hypothetical protein